MEQKFTVEEIRAAFRRLEDHAAAQGADAAYMWTLHTATSDGLRILTGEWSPEDDAPDEEASRDTALGARTVEAFDAAVVRLGETFEDRQWVPKVRVEIDPAWQPTPAGNEAMLEALEIYGQKRAGALGRGAARSEAETFALMEARRAYRKGAG